MKKHPSLKFKRLSAWHYWRRPGIDRWRLQEDAIASAIEILKKGVPGGLGENSHRFEEMEIAKPEVGRRSVAFAAADILELRSNRFREFLADSVCK